MFLMTKYSFENRIKTAIYAKNPPTLNIKSKLSRNKFRFLKKITRIKSLFRIFFISNEMLFQRCCGARSKFACILLCWSVQRNDLYLNGSTTLTDEREHCLYFIAVCEYSSMHTCIQRCCVCAKPAELLYYVYASSLVHIKNK